MKLRTFTADDMQIAMQMVRDALGDDAIIISTKKAGADGSVQVVAACDNEAEPVNDNSLNWFAHLNDNNSYQITNTQGAISSKITAKNVGAQNISLKAAQYIEKLLKHHGVADSTLKYLMDKMTELTSVEAEKFAHLQSEYKRWFAALLHLSFEFAPLKINDSVARHILIGAGGAGKTLTTAKIAAYMVKYNKPVHIITADNNKAGGVEQLAAITEILGINLVIASNKQSLQRIIHDIPANETIIVDSAGANPYDFFALKDLAEYASLSELEPVLIYAAGGDPIEAEEIARAFSFMGAEKMIITRTDAARRFGSILNAAYAANLNLSNLTGTEKILGAFEACSPEGIAKLFFDFQPKDEV
jgi:flagellar biosynthesis protein FlhF